MHFLQHADPSLLHQSLRGHVGRHPAQRPVDREEALRFFCRRDHAVGLGECGGKRLLHQDVRPVGRDQLDILRVSRRRRTQHDEVRLRRSEAAVRIGEHALGGNLEILDHRLHARRIVVAHTGDFHAGVLVAFPQ